MITWVTREKFIFSSFSSLVFLYLSAVFGPCPPFLLGLLVSFLDVCDTGINRSWNLLGAFIVVDYCSDSQPLKKKSGTYTGADCMWHFREDSTAWGGRSQWPGALRVRLIVIRRKGLVLYSHLCWYFSFRVIFCVLALSLQMKLTCWSQSPELTTQLQTRLPCYHSTCTTMLGTIPTFTDHVIMTVKYFEPVVVVQDCNPSTQEMETEESQV
jgi:hypothetical protein